MLGLHAFRRRGLLSLYVRARVCASVYVARKRLRPAGWCFNRKRSIRHRNRGICYRDDRPTIFASPFLSGELANRRDVVCFPDGTVRCLHSGKLVRLVLFFLRSSLSRRTGKNDLMILVPAKALVILANILLLLIGFLVSIYK